MPYAILRFQKRKAGGVAACERHNERKKISIRAPRAGRDSKNAQIVLHFFNNSQPKIEIQRPAQAGRAI